MRRGNEIALRVQDGSTRRFPVLLPSEIPFPKIHLKNTPENTQS